MLLFDGGGNDHNGCHSNLCQEHVNNFDLKNLKTKMVKDIQYELDYIGYAWIEK